MHRGVPPNKLPWGFHLPIWLKMFLLVVNYKHGVMFPPLRHYLNYLRRLKKHYFGNCIQNLKIDMEKNSLFSFTCRIAESMIEITISGWLSIANMVEVLRASSTHRRKRRKSITFDVVSFSHWPTTKNNGLASLSAGGLMML